MPDEVRERERPDDAPENPKEKEERVPVERQQGFEPLRPRIDGERRAEEESARGRESREESRTAGEKLERKRAGDEIPVTEVHGEEHRPEEQAAEKAARDRPGAARFARGEESDLRRGPRRPDRAEQEKRSRRSRPPGLRDEGVCADHGRRGASDGEGKPGRAEEEREADEQGGDRGVKREEPFAERPGRKEEEQDRRSGS